VAEPLVVVSYPVDAEIEAVNREVLGREAQLVFSSRMPADEREAALAHAEVLLSLSLPREVPVGALREATELRLLQLISAGVDHLDFEEIPQQVVVASNVGAYAEPMAEHVMAMVLACAKRLPQRHAALALGEFDQRSLSLTLDGAVCAIVGFGGIGKATARLMRAFGAQVWALNTSGHTEEPVSFAGTMADLDHVLPVADVIVLAVPLTRATRGLISEHELGLMKPTAILVNVARGDVVDESALYEHLRAHPDFCASIDAWWREPSRNGEFRTQYPFFELPNVIGSPHNSALVPGIFAKAARRAAENVRRFLQGDPLTGVARREDYVGTG
jgi:glycerate dehydrogenase